VRLAESRGLSGQGGDDPDFESIADLLLAAALAAAQQQSARQQ
jgi:hypothetical protein